MGRGIRRLVMNSEPQHPPPVSYRLPLRDAATNGLSEPEPWAVSLLPLLRGNVVWFCYLRWIVVAILILTGVVALLTPTGIWRVHLTPVWPLITAAVLAVFNLAYTFALPSVHRLDKTWPVRALLWIQIVVDLIVLTVVVHFLGSIESAACFMYLFHIVLACIFFPRLESLAVMLVAASAFLACVILEWFGVLDARTVLLDNPLRFQNVVPGAFRVVQLGFIFVIWGIIWYLASRLAGALIEREHNLAITNYRLEKSSKERTRHMLQTTHQLKAPFDAIRSSALLLVEGYCGTLTEDATLVAKKIAARCEVVSQQIVDMLQLANLRSEAEAAPAPADVNLAELIEMSIARVEPTAERRGIRIAAELEPVTVRAVEDHLKLLIENLTSNAVNYSHEKGTVTLICRAASPQEVELTVRDRGIGIPADKIEKVFNDFYRTNEAVQHNQRSTGLGLAIVRQVARTAGIAVQVESAPNWGTRFTLTIPRNSSNSRTLGHSVPRHGE